MLVSGRVVDLKRNSLGGFAPWVSEDDEPWVPRFPQKSWLAQGTGDEAGSVLEPDFFLISKKALEFSFWKAKAPLLQKDRSLQAGSRFPAKLVIWGDALEFWILLCKWLLGSILIESQTLRAQKTNVYIYIYYMGI